MIKLSTAIAQSVNLFTKTAIFSISFFSIILIMAGCHTPISDFSGKRYDDYPSIKRMSFPAGSLFQTQIDQFQISLQEPDDPKKPKIWEGPLIIRNLKTGKTWNPEISLITDLFRVEGTPFLIVVSVSGSMSQIHLIHMNLDKINKPIEVFSESIDAKGSRLIVMPGCECSNEQSPCECSAGRVYCISKHGQLIELKSESKDLTQKIIGVRFEGNKKVLHPKRADADLIP